MPRRIVAVGLGIALAGLIVTAGGVRLGRVAEQVDRELASSPGPRSRGSDGDPAAVGGVAALVLANLQLTAFVVATAAPPLPPPPPPPMPPPPPPPPPPTIAPPRSAAVGPGDLALEALRFCESGGDYGAVSAGGTYRGAYQFSQSTWDSVASRWRPDLVGVDPAVAAPADQDDLARALYDEAGPSPWPHCGHYL